jgi:hypothetical protein
MGAQTCGTGMKILAQLIRRRLRLETNEFGYCAIYENELQRVWPKNEENRKAKIAQFAKEHGFRLIYYKLGLCAMFVEECNGGEETIRGRRRGSLSKIAQNPSL